jgi:hypothetical protein
VSLGPGIGSSGVRGGGLGRWFYEVIGGTDFYPTVRFLVVLLGVYWDYGYRSFRRCLLCDMVLLLLYVKGRGKW